MYRSCLFANVIIGGGLCRMKMVMDPKIMAMDRSQGECIKNTI